MHTLLRKHPTGHTCTAEVWSVHCQPKYCTLQCHPITSGQLFTLPHGCSVLRGQGLGHCRVTASNVKPGLTAAASFARSLTSDFFSSYLLPYLKSLFIIPWLLFNAVDWSSSFFTCKLLSLGRHLQRVLGAPFTPHFFPSFLP